jgi:hypothetical protein
VSSKFFRAIDFASGFIILINSKFKIHTFNIYYKSRCKINGSKKLWTHILAQKVLNLPHFPPDGGWVWTPWCWLLSSIFVVATPSPLFLGTRSLAHHCCYLLVLSLSIKDCYLSLSAIYRKFIITEITDLL